MKSWILLLLLYLSSTLLLIHAQCPDFTNLSDSNVTCQYGNTQNPMQYTGVVVGRHTVITQQGTDPNTGHQLPFLPPGENAVVKLGNEQVGAEAEAITYKFIVDPDRAILLLKFAVVFEDPRHPVPDQPRFVVRVLNSIGQLVDSCAEYDVTAAGDIPGFQSYASGWIQWRPWTKVGIDLSDYAGQYVFVQFVNYDCSRHGHFGYAYYTASCINNRLTLDGCEGDEFTLTAPANFESYTWDNGDTLISSTYIAGEGTTNANCLITSVTGCQFTLSGIFMADSTIPIVSTTIYDTICEGDIYNDHFFDLPAQYNTGTHTYRNTFFNSGNCTGGEMTTTLHLTILPRYHHLYDAACQGDDYNAYGFHYTNLQTGNYTDTLVMVLPSGCDQLTILHLTVNPSFILSNSISGPTMVCDNEAFQYVLLQAEGLATLYWNVPVGVNILTGQGTAAVNLYFTNDAPNPAQIFLTGTNGCGSGSIPIEVIHSPTYHYFFQDTLCEGNTYHRYGFNLARQDSIGWFRFINSYITSQGCDSVRILQLLVTSTPSLTALAQPVEICIGQRSTIFALGTSSGFSQDGIAPTVAIGDILCTDSSIVKPTAWPVPGKIAKGIVFYVDNTELHGWAVHLQDQGINVFWTSSGYYNNDFSTIPNFTNARDAITDLNGYTNTQWMYYSHDCPVVQAIDFVNGWYLPTVGQLSLLFAELTTINASMENVGGTPFPMDQAWIYWSSTEHGASNAWVVTNTGEVAFSSKRSRFRVRSVFSF